jgi:hypothetical protein
LGPAIEADLVIVQREGNVTMPAAEGYFVYPAGELYQLPSQLLWASAIS